MNSFLFSKYTIFFLSFFSLSIVRIVGEVSLSFLFIIITIPFWFDINFFKRNDNNVFFKVQSLLFLILVVQILWVIFNNNTSILEQVKGISVTVYGMVLIAFYYRAVLYDKNVIHWYVLGLFFRSFFFSNMIALRDLENNVGVEEDVIWKFQVFPRIVLFIMLVYLFFLKKKIIKKKKCSIIILLLFFLVALIGMKTGVRSASIPLLFLVVVGWFQIKKRFTNTYRTKKTLIVVASVLYFLYSFFYVPNVLNGHIKGGNSIQLKYADNPYNPFHLLMIGRSDAIVPFYAFFDNPIIGWGYGTKDPDFKYHKLELQLQNQHEEFSDEYLVVETIPGHSCIGYYSCSYGIIVFICWIMILFIIVKSYLKSLNFLDEWMLYKSYLFFSVLWGLFFSTMSYLKVGGGESIAILLALLNINYNAFYRGIK